MYTKIKNFLNKLDRNVYFLSIVSFVANFSSTMIFCSFVQYFTMIDGSNHTKITALLIIKSIGEAFGYCSKVFIGFLSDLFRNRRMFLVFGYGVMLVTRPLFFLSTFPSIFGISICKILFGLANAIDKGANTARDGIRDSIIVRTDLSEQQNKENLGIRRIFSYAGSVIGGIVGSIYLYYANTGIAWTYSILYGAAIIPSLYGWYLIYKNIEDKSSFEGKNDVKITFLGGLKTLTLPLILFLLGIFFLYCGKIDEMLLYGKIGDLGYLNLVGFCFIFFYIASFLSSWLFSISKLNKINTVFSIIIGSLFLICGIFIAINFNNIYILIISVVFLGIFNGVVESLIVGKVFAILPEKDYKAFILGIVNTLLGLGRLSFGLIMKYSPNLKCSFFSNLDNFSKMMYVSLIPIIFGIIFILLSSFIRRHIQKKK